MQILSRNILEQVKKSPADLQGKIMFDII